VADAHPTSGGDTGASQRGYLAEDAAYGHGSCAPQGLGARAFASRAWGTTCRAKSMG